jgi:hypothetical protein
LSSQARLLVLDRVLDGVVHQVAVDDVGSTSTMVETLGVRRPATRLLHRDQRRQVGERGVIDTQMMIN